MKAELTRPGKTPSVLFDPTFTGKPLDELSMLRSEVEMLVDEDAQLMKVAAAAALFVSQLQKDALPEGALNTASILAKLISEIPDDVMGDALDMLNH